ncbi:MAG: hypothetical protein A2V98_10200 [Planctomycetes bacterium RBG_16_64_12]|nr:MAG: hypothetical protein A2V98_10200 [Planctomycetes bacterium RBG_16_64_12]
MKFEKLVVVLPCRSVEGYTLDREVDHAEELLSAWSALYHPALLASAQQLPRWVSAQEPPKDPAGSLIMLPGASEKILAPAWLDQAAGSGACVVRELRRRDEMVDAALERLDGGPGLVDPNLAADFLALGFCHLQMEVLIRDAGYDMGTDIQYYGEHYHDYTGQFDRELLRKETIAAAAAALEGDEQTARDHLRTAFAQLCSARRGLPYTYSADEDPHLLDLTLVAPTTLGEPLREALAEELPTNLLISGETIEEMARREPATLAALKEALRRNTVALVGGEFCERAVPLLAPEAIVDQFERGLAAYRRHLDERPVVFGRRRFGLSPVLPQILRKFGFLGALHFTLDDGRFPTSSQSKIWWVGIDGTEVEALAKLPLDASRSGCFLNFAGKVSNAAHHKHHATAVLAHWPGQTSPWYDDLRRIAAYSPVLGKFRTITEYLEQSRSISSWTRAGPDEYRSPYLRQAVSQGQPDPISRWVRCHCRRADADAARTLSAMADLAGRGTQERSSREELPNDVDDVETGRAQAADSSRHAALVERLHRLAELTTAQFARLVPRAKAAAEKGYLVVNPWSFSRRVLADVSELNRLPAVGGPIRAAGESAGRKEVVVDVPAMGFAWVGAGSPGPTLPEKPKLKRKKGAKKRDELPMAEENVLRNEYFEVTIDPITGAVKAIDDYVSRGARLAQQIALRVPPSRRSRQDGFEEDALERDYSIMAADEITVTSSGPVVGRVVCRGRLVTRDGRRAARFVETLEVRRASRILEWRIDLDIEQQPEADPWNSYYAARFAWHDAAADVYRGVGLADRPTEQSRVESPHFVDVRSDRKRITILTGGLPYHRRIGVRKLDTLLIVQGETARSFRLGVGVDLTHPVPAALDFLAPQHVQAEEAPPAATASGWLFHVDAKNVVATHWEPLWAVDRAVGFRVRLLETEGRPCQARLRSFRAVRSARKVDFQSEKPTELSVEDDTITVDVKAHEWAQIEADFRQ